MGDPTPYVGEFSPVWKTWFVERRHSRLLHETHGPDQVTTVVKDLSLVCL